ncbi:MAG: 50S ribosomal protein L11 [Candidatus Shikimatogenerans bostrichidophilus]|nr:MAG: 50S ribosomal protein L11 [Candidatus Shikimatogenerans bostrichidophilus]
MKKIIKILKLNIKGGYANPSPPIGPSLGSVGVNIMEFCKKFNEKTISNEYKNIILPVNVIVYEDKTFDLKIKKQSIKNKIFNILKIEKGSKEPKKNIIAKIKLSEIKKIAEYKISDLNCFKLSSAISMIIGTLKSFGIDIIK